MSKIKEQMGSSKSYVFGRAREGALPKVRKAEGLWIEDDRGNRYLNASGGAAVTNVGHGRREIAEAAKRLRHPSRWRGRFIWQTGGPRESGSFPAGSHITA
jgi:4-aminobutyrate aminotransferase-like enzyme